MTLGKEKATHSSVLAWIIPGTGEAGGLPSMGSYRVGHDWSDLAAAAAADVFLELSCFFYDSVDVGIWSLVPLPFLNPAWTSRILSSHTVEAWLGEIWALLCLSVRRMQWCGSSNILWHCLSLGLEWKLTFPVLWPLLSFLNLLAYWVQHFHSIIFQDLK